MTIPPNHSPSGKSNSPTLNGSKPSSLRKEPQLQNAEIDSPPLTSSLHSRNSASSHQETVYLQRVSILRYARLAISVLSIGLGAAIIGCEADVLKRYNDTKFGSSWGLQLWPVDLDVNPTVVTLVAGAVSIALSLLYLLVVVVPSPYSHVTLSQTVFLSTSLPSLLLSLSVLIYNPMLITSIFSAAASPSSLLTSHNPQSDLGTHTLQTWTCGLYNGVNAFNRDASTLGLPSLVVQSDGETMANAPAGFRHMCVESRVAYGLVVALVIVQLSAVGVAVAGMGLERRMDRLRKGRHLDMSQEAQADEKA